MVLILILGRNSCTSLSGRWRSWSGILGQPTEIAVNQPSWPKHRKTYPAQRCQQSYLTQVPIIPRWIDNWPTSERRILTRLSVRNWGRRMCTKPTQTISTILLWPRQTGNYRIKRHWTPPPRQSSQAETPLGTWWYEKISDYQKYLNMTSSDNYDWQSEDCIIPCSTPIRTKRLPGQFP